MPPYSGAELRTRDKAIEEKHQNEIKALQTKTERLRRAFDERSNALHGYTKFADNVAARLGFRTLDEVKASLDISDEPMTYKELADHAERLKAELATEKRDKQSLTDELLDLREERDLLRLTLAHNQSAGPSEPTAQSLAKDLVKLQMDYDALQKKGVRTAARFKECFTKWQAFKQWMQDEERGFAEITKGFKGGQKARHRHALYLRRQQKLKEMDLDSEDEPENALQITETPVTTIKHRSGIPPIFSSSPTVIASPNITPEEKLLRTLAPSTRTPLEFETIQISRPSTSLPIRSSAPIKSLDVIDLSDTEDDSQGFVPPNQIAERPRQPGIDLVEPQSTSKAQQRTQLPAPHPTLPPRPEFPQFGDGGEKPKKQRHSDVFSSATLLRVRPEGDNIDEERPRKTRRFSSPVRNPLTTISTTAVRSSRDGANTRTSRGRENRVVVSDKGAENAPASTPANTSASRQFTDYSAFKGRGRYGNAHGSVNDTINALYAIDPAQNGGIDFQYDAVVRGKEDRRRMEGGDCECCRDYYEAIGPLPNRLQPPLWRSPPNSPQKGKPCRRHGDSGRDAAITSHKQAISRHRHNWARASTPPSYWSIGFPSTQEAERINEQAETMHEQKRKAIQAEAENGGRYYKTR
ncbi:DNA repair protein endonuclease SAE2/CtIP C-terminus-domain-containing protein [Mycena galericulata]|nr:DNA repair protein endonuclease SAE2/CtIP C-terminus-domain-containing protein [Mycena galericulata]